ncbi:TlpA family protein disulfide reductase [Fusicatenibacter faecihominis]|uniref:TlpA family protein disulfide reductase n=1 Tax=Fusicatenibacter faecihominis TaxID=2881276 RepID=A0AAE3J7N8_9FIRM|nr:TlpA disulfide reductase family protein [Fusicatenibacter faecihominis]MCC2191084.1 TlpA family protein disulfide reductase [Fusicatenibacter faecihominis]
MNKKRIMAILAACVFSAVSVNPTAVMADSDTEPTTETGEMFYVDGDSTDGQMIVSEDGTPLQKTVKASEMGMSSEETLDFPFMGLSAELPDELKKQMDSADVVLLTDEDWTDDFDNIKYAHLFWSKLTDEQKEEEVNMLGTGYKDWLASIERIGALGVYSTDVIDDLDTITGCDNHEELGTSSDGKFKYYLSTNSEAEKDLTDEIENIKTTLGEMTPFNGQSAFEQPQTATSDADNVGTFETTDIDGNTYTEKVFSDYDLTLVNAFTTWCSPCVNEMPELEKLYQEMKDQGVDVVGMVLDSVSEDGTPDDSIVQKAQLLKEKTGVTYPLLIPDKGFLNGRISGLQSFPESFFVDKDGNIVGDPIMGSNTFDGWKEAVEKQLAALKGE